jgi:hypothetical protein
VNGGHYVLAAERGERRTAMASPTTSAHPVSADAPRHGSRYPLTGCVDGEGVRGAPWTPARTPSTLTPLIEVKGGTRDEPGVLAAPHEDRGLGSTQLLEISWRACRCRS